MTNSTAWLGDVLNKALEVAAGGTIGTAVTLGYCTGMTIAADGTLTPVGEPVGVGGYVTKSVDLTALNAWVRDGSTQNVYRSNTANIDFPTATADQGTFEYIIVRRGGSGAVSAIVLITGTPITVNTGDIPRITAGGLRLIAS